MPPLQVLVSSRLHDGGMNVDPPDTGYTRFLVAPRHYKFIVAYSL